MHFLEWKCMNFDKKNSLKFVPKVPINGIPALVQIMAWRRPGDKPLSETMMVSLLTHIWDTRPQWVNNMLWWQDMPTWWLFNTCLIQITPIYLRSHHKRMFWMPIQLKRMKLHWRLYAMYILSISFRTTSCPFKWSREHSISYNVSVVEISASEFDVCHSRTTNLQTSN